MFHGIVDLIDPIGIVLSEPILTEKERCDRNNGKVLVAGHKNPFLRTVGTDPGVWFYIPSFHGKTLEAELDAESDVGEEQSRLGKGVYERPVIQGESERDAILIIWVNGKIRAFKIEKKSDGVEEAEVVE